MMNITTDVRTTGSMNIHESASPDSGRIEKKYHAKELRKRILKNAFPMRKPERSRRIQKQIL